MTGRTAASGGIHVDRIACTGHGVCAAMLPRLVTLDEWGYPIVQPRAESTAARQDQAVIRAAVTLCPARALRAD